MTIESTSTNRVTALRESLRLSQKEFGEKIGITQGALSQLESGKSTLSLNTITMISQVFNVDCNWLILGIEDYDKSYFNHYKKVLESPLIPLVKEEAHAGYISQCADEEYIESLEFYKIPGFESGNYRLFEVEGDSMLPTVCPKEFVVTEQVKNISQLDDGLVYVVITQDGIVVKRVYKQQAQSGYCFMLKSDNPVYQNYFLIPTEVIEVWQVKAKISSIIEQEAYVQNRRFESIENEIKQLKEHISSRFPLQK